MEPEDSHDNHPGGVEGVGALVVAGGEGAVLLAASDQVLDEVSGVVGGPIEGAGPALRAELGDGEADAASSQVGAVLAAGVALIGHGASGPEARAAPPR